MQRFYNKFTNTINRVKGALNLTHDSWNFNIACREDYIELYERKIYGIPTEDINFKFRPYESLDYVMLYMILHANNYINNRVNKLNNPFEISPYHELTLNSIINDYNIIYVFNPYQVINKRPEIKQINEYLMKTIQKIRYEA
jgi:hypothetical protein